MSDQNALFPFVQDYIDFETLFLQARAVLHEYASTSWSNTDEHDPGVTLLQAMCYNTSDIAYRNSLPLLDLLTPAPGKQIDGEGIFPAVFGPQRTLTCGPISEEDYRRALLDLHSTGTDTGYFYFDNVHLVREPMLERYRYWYNHEFREFSFTQPSSGSESTEITLQGNYFLYLQPSRQTQADNQMAQAALEAYLLEHRNLGEAVSRIIWVEPDDISVTAVIELEGDVGLTTSIAAILANIYSVIEHYITPPIPRYSTEELQAQGIPNEEIYQGPELQYGWITHLPPALDYEQPITINLARLVNALLAIEGIKSIRSLAAADSQEGSPWVWVTHAGTYPRLWGDDPIVKLASGSVIQLIAHGIKVTASPAEIHAELTPLPVIRNLPVTLPYTQWRNPARYYPVTDQIPPCYGLLQPPTTPEQLQLHQFLLPFEQLLANDCQQLALLPDLLSFKRPFNDIVWGTQWPFVQPSVSNEVFNDCSSNIKEYLRQYSHDMSKELSCVDYLLGYFNGRLAQRDFMIDPMQFMKTQQGYLGGIAELTYNRTNIRVDQVSALQQRIAARLGVGGAGLFNGQTPLDKLPFYLIEHRALLPVYPDSAYDHLEKSVGRMIDIIDGVEYLTLILPSSCVAPLIIGQLVDLIVTVNRVLHTIRALMIDRIDSSNLSSQRFSLRVSSNTQLQRYLERILDPGSAVEWRNCSVWMIDMYYPVVYADNQDGLSLAEKRLISSPQSPYPAMVKVGDRLSFELSTAAFSGVALANAQFYLEAEVTAIDVIASTLVVKHIQGEPFPLKEKLNRYFWYFDSNRQSVTDRFSFMVSVVADRDQLNSVTTDPYAANDWFNAVVLEELPSNISLLMHWLPHDQFLNFACNYKVWQNSGALLGDASYNILRSLTLGCLPSSLTGIGAMVIATDAQRTQVVGEDGDQWNRQYIVNNELFYVPLGVEDA